LKARRKSVPSISLALFHFLSPAAMRSNVVDHTRLVSAMAVGDERAAARLYDEYSRVMFAMAVQIVGEHADAEEVVLEAFTQAWNGAALYQRQRSSVLSWLAMMTRTRALDLVRARTRRTRAVNDATITMAEEPIAIAAATQTVSEKLEEEERAVALGRAIGTLAQSQRVAIELAFFKGLTHPEIAEFLGEPLGTIKTRIRLGIQRLRHLLAGVTYSEEFGRTLPINFRTTRGYL
jgi:RNA polymerase sigma-70 factor (ECF subfamily)